MGDPNNLPMELITHPAFNWYPGNVFYRAPKVAAHTVQPLPAALPNHPPAPAMALVVVALGGVVLALFATALVALVVHGGSRGR